MKLFKKFKKIAHYLRRLFAQITKPAAIKIVLLGKPGSGKSTQGALLAKRYRIKHISIGDECAAALKNESHPYHIALSAYVQAIQEKWAPLPDELAVGIYQYATSGLIGWVIDGFPRTLKQAMLSNIESEATHIILYEIDDITSINRMLLRGRAGDTYDVIIHRQNIEAARLPEMMAELRRVCCIDAKLCIQEVFQNTINHIECSSKDNPRAQWRADIALSPSTKLGGRYGTRTR